ncbi:MAG: TolB family protein [Acidobacteriota bacterium]
MEFGVDGEYPWASWSPDGRRVVCLTKREIQVVDLERKAVVQTYPRQGIYQQLFWSPDGKWFCGVGNHGSEMWTVVRLNLASGRLNPVRSYQNCTPDWFPDSDRILFSSRPANQKANKGYGWTELWMARGDGSEAWIVYGEEGSHIYGGALSPDPRYVLFTKTGADPEMRSRYPQAKSATVLTIGEGWEPSWTYTEPQGKKR